MTIETVLGPIPDDRLGQTLMHEHIFTGFAELRAEYPRDVDAQDERAVRTLTALAETGFRSLVDLTVYGLGRDVRRIARIAEKAGVNIIPATGIYTFADMPGYFKNYTIRVDEDFISSVLIREIEQGIGETGIHAGIIKFATDARGLTPDIEKIIAQSAIAQLRTGVPISTHTDAPTRNGLVQQELLRTAGVDLGRVVIGHSGDSTDLGYLEQLIENGSWLGMDRFGHEPSGTLADRIATVAAMCERGYADRMVLSHDTNVTSDNTPEELRSSPLFANWHFRCVPDIVLPALRERGVSEADIEKMTVTNPVAILATPR